MSPFQAVEVRLEARVELSADEARRGIVREEGGEGKRERWVDGEKEGQKDRDWKERR